MVPYTGKTPREMLKAALWQMGPRGKTLVGAVWRHPG
jgi:hypothetical protein